MAVVDSIREWAEQQAPWLKLAIIKLLNQDSLQEKDKAEILSLLRAPASAAPTLSVPAPVGPAHVARRSKFSLVEIKNAAKVNALAEGQVLSFSKEGLTVIFGENGSGKSGYSRILKNACQARDRADSILTNVFADVPPGTIPEATIRISVDDQETDVVWTTAAGPHPSLKKIAVFDSNCARFYIDEKNDVVYQPYGLDVFTKLVQFCSEAKAIFAGELAYSEKVVSPVVHFQKESAVKTALQSLSADTNVDALFAAYPWNDADATRTKDLEGSIATIRHTDPKTKIEGLQRRVERIDRVLVQIASIISGLDEAQVDGIRRSLEETETAKAAAALASSNQFAAEPLPGIGGAVWKAMFLSAKDFSEKNAYCDHPFPNVADGSLCPLCLQELGPGAKDRLGRFAAFMQDRTQEVARSKEAGLVEGLRRLSQIPLAGDLADELVLAEMAPYQASVRAFRASAVARYAVVNAVGQSGAWTIPPILAPTPSQDLAGLRAKLVAEAQELAKNSHASELAKLETELDELSAKRILVERKAEVMAYVVAQVEIRKIGRLVAATDTTAISRKASKLAEEAVTGALGVALEKELKDMGIGHYQFELEKHAKAGVTYHQLKMKTKAKSSPDVAKVLSEGEQRVVSIASFLAELSTAEDACGIVFDDPVSSLDHLWRGRIANRLALEGKNRQVVVLTHDIYFLLELIEQCNESQVQMKHHSLRKLGGTPGLVNADLPWDAMKAKERAKVLETLAVEVERLSAAGEEEESRNVEGRFYSMLRSTWERAVEELIFNGAVLRFRMGIETQRLKKVILDDADFVTITNNMSIASRRTPAHDSAGGIGGVAPNPAEMRTRIKAFGDFATALKIKQDALEIQRKAMV